MNFIKLFSKHKHFCILAKETRRNKSRFVGSYQAQLFHYVSKHRPYYKRSDEEKLFQNQSPETLLMINFPITTKTSLHNIFRALDVTMENNPNMIISSNIYKQAMKVVPQVINEQNIDKCDLIKLMFYIGLQKKTPQAHSLMKIILSRIEDSLNSLTLQDVCVLANSIFKTSTSNIGASIISHIKMQIHLNFQTITKDPATLLCLTKLLRITKQYDYQLLKRIADSTFDWAQNFTTKAHIIALFAESKLYEKEFLAFVTKSGLGDLRDTSTISKSENTHFQKRVRGKDISRFLWALGTLGIEVTENDITSVILPQLQDRLQLSKEYIKQPAVLVDSVMSLCVMGHYSKELTEWIFSDQATYILKEQKKIQPWTKLNVLLVASKIECPEIAHGLYYNGPPLPEPTAEFNLEQRKPLKRVFEALRCLAPSLRLETPECCFQIAPLHIAGIIIHSRQRLRNELHIEVADSTVCLHDSNCLTGLMKLKLRLLKNMGVKNMLLVGPSVLAQDDANLFMWLEDNLQMYF